MSSRSSSESSGDLVQEKMRTLAQERQALADAWDNRSKQLKQCSELQVMITCVCHFKPRPLIHHTTPFSFPCSLLQLFLRDAEQVDSAISGQEAFLANEDLGTSVDTVEELLAKHEEFSRKSAPVDDRIRVLSEQASKLVHAGHYDAERCVHHLR